MTALDQDACYRALVARDARFDGRIFVCVATTGIYCRPVCPARTPHRKNVTFVATAAAAERAGFRACLRCRPETSPRQGAWNGASNTVNRALVLIDAGALNHGGVEALAGRLGVGGRQLRRLFDQHLGVSPLDVAQTRRVHLAKQLIHETTLPMAQVAFASGFRSVRRFNETFQTLYQRPPAALRRTSSPAGGEAVRIRLRFREPYDFGAILAFLAFRAIPGVEAVENGVWRRTVGVAGAVGTVAVSRASRDQLLAEIRFPKVSAIPEILSRVRRVFDVSADPAAINGHLAADPHLAPLIAARPGLRVPGGFDGFELAVRAVLGQQITVHAAVKLAGRLASDHGETLPLDLRLPGLTTVFPCPERLALDDLSRLPVPGARSRAIVSLAAAAAADPTLFGPGTSLEQSVAKLRALPGIGEWTAQYIAIRQLREPDAFPAADIGLMRALETVEGRPNAATLLARAEAWRPWRAYAAQHLWTADAHNLERPDDQRAA